MSDAPERIWMDPLALRRAKDDEYGQWRDISTVEVTGHPEYRLVRSLAADTVTPDVTPDKEPVRHEDGIPHQSHRWVTACDSERGMCADCGVDIEDDEALEPCTTTAAPDVEAAPDLARPEDLSQWLRRGALWALGYVPDEAAEDDEALEPCTLAVTPDVKAEVEALLADRDNYRESMGGLASLARGLAAERDALREEIDKLAYSKGCLREVIDRQQEANAALRAQLREAMEALRQIEGPCDGSREKIVARGFECDCAPCIASRATEGG